MGRTLEDLDEVSVQAHSQNYSSSPLHLSSPTLYQKLQGIPTSEMGIHRFLNRTTEIMSQSRLLSNTAIQYYSSCCGAASGIFFILAFIIADFIPPTKPSWDAETTAHFYQVHLTRIRAGAAILMIAGGFYLPFAATISYQIRRIPGVPYMIHQVQLASAAAGIWTFMLPGIVLAIASYRPYRPVEITQALNDFFVSNTRDFPSSS